MQALMFFFGETYSYQLFFLTSYDFVVFEYLYSFSLVIK